MKRIPIFLLICLLAFSFGSCRYDCSCYCYTKSTGDYHSYELKHRDCRDGHFQDIERNLQQQYGWDTCNISIAK